MRFAGFFVTVAQADLTLVVVHDGGVGQGHAEGMAGQIRQRVLARAGGLGMHHPRLAPVGQRGRDSRIALGKVPRICRSDVSGRVELGCIHRKMMTTG